MYNGGAFRQLCVGGRSVAGSPFNSGRQVAGTQRPTSEQPRNRSPPLATRLRPLDSRAGGLENDADLRQNRLVDDALDVGQPHVAPGMAIGQALVIEAEQVQHRGDGASAVGLGRVASPLGGRSAGHADPDAATAS
jgi:hypothetical protein